MQARRWQDGCNLVFGIWLLLTPIMFEYDPRIPVASINAYIMGAAIIAFSMVAVYMPRVWEEWINMALGVWVLASPWILGFTVQRNETETAAIVGLLVITLATWAMLRDKAFRKWWQDHHLVH